MDALTPQQIADMERALGKALAEFRKAHRAKLTQIGLSKEIPYSRSAIANTETGALIPHRSFWECVDKRLGAGGVLVEGYDRLQQAKTEYHLQRAAKSRDGNDTASWSTSSSQPGLSGERAVTVEDMKRRTAMALPALAFASMVSGEPWQRSAQVLEQPGHLDEQTMEHMEWSTLDFFRREEYTPARQLVSELHGHIDRLKRVLSNPPSDYALRLCMTTGEALTLAGWLAFDSKNYGLAGELLGQATYAARDAGDGPLAACILAYRSYMAEATGDMASAREMLTEAQTYARSERSATTRSWLAAREAEVDAAMGDETAALRALDRALTAYDYAHPHQERPWTGFFTPTRLGSMAVTTYARLDHQDLEDTTQSVVSSMPATDAKIKAVILADVAIAAIQRGQHEQGVRFGHDALDATLVQEATLGRQRLQDLHLTLQDQREVPELADLDDRLVANIA